MKKLFLFLILVTACNQSPRFPHQRLLSIARGGDTLVKLEGDDCKIDGRFATIHDVTGRFPATEENIIAPDYATLICESLP